LELLCARRVGLQNNGSDAWKGRCPLEHGYSQRDLVFNMTETDIIYSTRIAQLIDRRRRNASTSPLRSALELSFAWADQYARSHVFRRTGMKAAAMTTLAVARYEALLMDGRRALRHRFTVGEYAVLIASFRGELMIPQDYDIAKAVAEDNGILWADYRTSELAPLIDNLVTLPCLERSALRDLIERYWYHGQHQCDSLESFLMQNGL
jgi:hypothetical protein